MLHVLWLGLFVYLGIIWAFSSSREENQKACEIRWYGLSEYNRLKSEGKSTKPKLTPDSELNHWIEHGDKHQKEFFTWCRDVYYPEIRKLYKKGEV